MSNELDKILISYKQLGFEKELERLFISTLQKTWLRDVSEREKVQSIVEDVDKRRDEAVAEYTDKYDGIKLTPDQFRITEKELEKAHSEIDPKLLNTIRQAIENVRTYQTEIFICNKNTHPGIKYTPIERVGICVPGAAAPLPSTVIMTAVPAQVAGVKEIAVVSPPKYQGTIHPVILAVCYELKISEVYRIGGAQAVAALAFGDPQFGRTKVDKIVGPGNAWVQMAKREVFGLVDIDSIAGPSEVLIIANEDASPKWVAADMLSQLEHMPGSAMLFTNSQHLAEKVLQQLKSLCLDQSSHKTCGHASKKSIYNLGFRIAMATPTTSTFGVSTLESFGDKIRGLCSGFELSGFRIICIPVFCLFIAIRLIVALPTLSKNFSSRNTTATILPSILEGSNDFWMIT